MNAHCIHNKHNAEDVRLKARPVGRCPKARLYVIAYYHARFNYVAGMLSKQCLDSGFWAAPEFMILNQRYPGTNPPPASHHTTPTQSVLPAVKSSE